MKRIFLILFGLSALLVTQGVLAAPEPIDFANATMIERLKKSFENPIDLYQSTKAGADHQNKLFTVRTLFRHQPGGPSSYEKKILRNEICANSLIHIKNTAGFTIGNLEYSRLPGSIGIYKHNHNLVAIADDGFTGERLDSVLRKLSSANSNDKKGYAAFYATAMAEQLGLIHEANITVNDLSLRNFYVRPDGKGVQLYDLSQAKNLNQLAALAQAAPKVNEWKDFVLNTLPAMYSILFPARAANNSDVVNDRLDDLLQGNWQTHAWDEVQYYARTNGRLGPPATAVTLPANIGAVNGWLAGERPPYIAGKTAPFNQNPPVPILKVDHRPIAGANDQVLADMGNNTGFVLWQDATAGNPAPNPNEIAVAIGPKPASEAGNPWVNLTTLCQHWTGD